jgi:uncharacterized membrane protein YcaP (DUF421 family)
METVLRVGFIYVFILALLRVMGKREVSQLTPMELVLLILIPELVAQALVREDFSMTNAIVAVTTLMSLVFVTSVLTYKFKRFREIVEGRAALLVEHGVPVRETMDQERILMDELAAEIRKAGIERLDDVKWAVLETGGKIAVIGYSRDETGPPPEADQIV